jgi:hypothetical protein
MNHDFIIDTIIKNNGAICGGYVREWIINGKPSDIGWNDIDIRCSIENQKIIKNTINSLYPNIEIDFRINNYLNTISPLCFDLFLYDGNFKVIDEYKEYNDKWMKYIKEKKCVVISKYLPQLKRKILRNKMLDKWIFLNIKDEVITNQLKIFASINLDLIFV